MSTITAKKKVFNNVLEAIGDTPMIRINRITKGVVEGDGPRQDRDRQSWQFDQGPHGGPDDRGRRAEGAAQAWRHDHRGHVWQYRDGAGDCGGRQGLPLRLHDDRQAVEGKDRRAQGVRRRSHRLSDQRRSRGSAVLLFGVVAAREGNPELLEGQPVRQSVEQRRALRGDGARDLGTDRGPGHAPRRRRRHRRHDQRRRPVPQGTAIRRSRCGASTPTGRSSRSTRRRGSSTRTRSIPTSPRGSARTSCPRTSTSASSITSRR